MHSKFPFRLLFPPSSPSASPTFTLGTTECVRDHQNQSPLATLHNHSTIHQPAHVHVLGAAVPPLGAHHSLPPIVNTLHIAHNKTSCWHLYCCDSYHQGQLRDEEGGGIHDLCINGGGRPVTPENVFEYVQQYTLLRMVNWCEPMLKVSTS